jgi:cellulose synthase/poly-beta-1,6-N-acetylglucosamine synthase-like glycosyltransferase
VTVATVVGVLLLPVAVAWALPLLSELLSLGVVFQRRRARGAPSATPCWADRQRMVILVPAHDEVLLIESCVRSLLQLRSARSETSVVVIADNCADNTAAIARSAGARVLERSDLVRIGKPHAIAWAMTQLDIAAFDAALIIDADTVVDPGVADALAAAGELKNIAVQAYFGLSNERDSWLSLLAGLLARVRYEGQYLQKAKAGLNCPLTGNGMCLGVGLLARAGWAPDALTENWELYARYTALGERILFAPEARLHSQEAHTLRQSATQRRRWQAGRISALRTYGWALVTSRRCGARQKLDALCELAAPGPVLHSGIGLFLALATATVPSVSAHIAAGIFAASVLPLAVWSANAWVRSPNRLQLAVAVLRLPVYLIWRVCLSLFGLFERETRWKRSPRHVSGTGAEE